MERNHLQPNNTHNASFAPHTPSNANQQGANPQARPVPPLHSAADLSNNPAAKHLQAYHTSSTPQGPTDPLAPDNWNLPEYQPIKPGKPYLEKLADEAANTKKIGMLLKHAQEYEAEGDFKDAEETYAKALKYTENAEHYKAYGECLKQIYLALSRIPLTPAKDEAKERVYKEKAAKAFYYLGDLYVKESAWQEAQAAYRASYELAVHEAPLQALLEVSQKLGIKEDITGALVKLADFYTEKGDTALAIKMLEEALQVEKSSTILEKLAALHGQAGGEESQSQVHEITIHRFELQISQDPKNIGLYRDYAWFLKSIGRQDEARAVKKRIDGLLQQNFQTLQQKVIKQKTKIGGLKEQVATLEKKVEFLEEQTFSLDFSLPTNIQDAYLISLVNKNSCIKHLNLEGCTNITNAGLAALKGLTQLTELNLHNCIQLTDAGLQHLTGLTQLTSLHLGGIQITELRLYNYTQITDAGLRHLAALTQLTELNLHSCHNLSDAGLRHLAGLSQLTSLNFVDCHNLSDAGLQHLAGLTQLSSLDLNHQQLSDAGLRHLAGLSQLSSLDLSCCQQIIGAGLKHLAGLTQLTSLNLYSCYQLTDAGLQHIAGLTQLTSLDLSYCNKITDEGLEHLAGFTQLTDLSLYGCGQLTSNAKEQLKQQIPGLTIH